MTRPIVGLALSGGGIRGLVHIGVLKTLVKAGIPIDCISGTSMGGVIAAAFACGIPIDQIEEKALCLTSTRQVLRLVDVTGPRRGVLSQERVRDFLSDFFLDRNIENLPVPLAIPAVDLIQGREVVFTSGLLLPVVMATMAIPGLFPAVEIGPYHLVDGGVLNNLPNDLLHRLGATVSIAVNAQFDPHDPETWTGAGRPHFPIRVPNFFRDLYQSELIMISRITQAHLSQFPPDLVLHPAIPSGITMLVGFHRAAEVIAAGEQCAREALPQIEKLLS